MKINMDYSKLTYFSLQYSEFSQYYKDKLLSFLDSSFKLPSYELHDFTIINGFLLNNEIIATLSLLKHDDLKGVLEKNNNHEMVGYSNKGDDGLFIYNVVVKDEFKRKRLAEVLLNLCIRNYPNTKYLHAQVKKDNEASFNLFFKCGFQIENEMHDNDNGIVCVMSKDL